MFRSSALFLTLIHFLHLTLAVPNPDNGVLSRDPAATVGPFPKTNGIADLTAPANTTELTMTGTEISSLAESSTTTNNIAPRAADSNDCTKIKDNSPKFLDVFNAWKGLSHDCPLQQSPGGCRRISLGGPVAIYACGDPKNPTPWTCEDIAARVKEYAMRCRWVIGIDLRVGGKFRYTGKSYVKIVAS